MILRTALMTRVVLKKFIRSHFRLVVFILSLALIVISALSVFIHFAPANGSSIIIYFDLYRDRSVLGSVGDLNRFIFLGIVLVTINYFIIRELTHKNVFLANVMALGTLILSLLILIAVGGIIHIN